MNVTVYQTYVCAPLSLSMFVCMNPFMNVCIRTYIHKYRHTYCTSYIAHRLGIRTQVVQVVSMVKVSQAV